MKIAGPGRLRVARDGLEIDAFQADARAKIEAALAVVVFVAVVVLLQFSQISTPAYFALVPRIAFPLLGGVLGGMVYFSVIAGREKHLRDRRVQLVIPWASVGAAMRGLRQPGSVVVNVNSQNGPQTLHFDPAGGASELLDALRRRPAA